MSPDQRLDAYYAQNGSQVLTPAQPRRFSKKYCQRLARDAREVERDMKLATP